MCSTIVSILHQAISYVTLFFRPKIFEVRVMAALTSLLVVATLFTQVRLTSRRGLWQPWPPSSWWRPYLHRSDLLRGEGDGTTWVLTKKSRKTTLPQNSMGALYITILSNGHSCGTGNYMVKVWQCIASFIGLFTSIIPQLKYFRFHYVNFWGKSCGHF